MAAEKLSSKGQAWFCTTGLPSDIVIEVDDMSFHLHKFPLMSKSRKLHQIITDEEKNAKTRSRSCSTERDVVVEEEDEEIEEELHLVTLSDFPGGSETFEIAAKFCYGVKIDLTSSNVAPLRCAGEYLEMTEDFSEENLISKTERFLTQSVLRNPKESVKTLKSCERLIPLSETLNITQRCIDSIAARASSSCDPSSILGWPINDNDGIVESKIANPMLWNGIDTGTRGRNNPTARSSSLFDDLTVLSLPIYSRLISAMKSRDLSSEIIEGSLFSYAKKSIPGLSRSDRKHSTVSLASESEQRELLETLITNLPLKKTPRSGQTTTRFLFGLLRTANIINASEDCRTVLEKKIGVQLEEASLDDLLVPSYSYLIETLYDVECVERILGYFLGGLEERSAIEDGEENRECVRSPAINPLMCVGKLVDGYLSEIASDANLKPEKFYDLAVALPDHARVFDDGLYRAVDVFLKAHPWISEEEREKICAVIESQKLTLEACTHAAQNERLPLRAVVEVLFFEQLQLRQAIAGSLFDDNVNPPPDPSSPPPPQDIDTWRSTIRENQVLRFDMDSVRSRVHELERECTAMRRVIEKMDRSAATATRSSGNGGGGGGGGWGSFSKKFGCKFKTQVCDSHERTVVEPRKVRQ